MEKEEEEGDRILVKRFYKERDWTYEEPGNEEEREEKFRSLYHRWFRQIGLKAFFERLITEFPDLIHREIPIFVRRAWERKGEGAELYREGHQNKILIRLQVIRLEDRESLAGFLRQELMHLSDILDPAFEYDPAVVLGGENAAEDDLIRQRFALLWNLYVEGRMARRGWKVSVPLEVREREFEKAFPNWGPGEKARVFREVCQKGTWTQQDLIRLARAEKIGGSQWRKRPSQAMLRKITPGSMSSSCDFRKING